MHSQLWNVALLSSPYSCLTYKIPPYFPSDLFQAGMRVLVPLGSGNSFRAGVLLERNPDFAGKRLKALFWPLDKTPLISGEYLDLARELALRHMALVGRVLANMLPALLKEVPEYLQDKGGERIDLKRLYTSPTDAAQCAKHWIEGSLDMPPFRCREEQELLDVLYDPPWPILPNAHKQQEVMDYIWTNGPCTRKHLARCLGGGVYPVLRSLLKKGLLGTLSEKKKDNEEDSPESIARELSEQQKAALQSLSPRIWEDSPASAVLHGVTGSGKTLVYAELARETLRSGQDVLILAPEVALAKQLYSALQVELPGYTVLLHHGAMTPAARAEMFSRLSAGDKPRLLVGTRSTLFMFTHPPRLIVLDEEHDESFKQDSNMVYQAKEVAYFWLSRSRGLLVLGSATPDIKTYWAASRQNVGLVSMPQRLEGKRLPPVELVDLNMQPPESGALTEPVHRALMDVLERGEQAIIMHNRRGYSPLLYCQNCQEIARCTNCYVSLTFHKKRNQLVCHYCGKTVSLPVVCSNCGYSSFIPLGEGTEKLEEYLSRHLPPDTGVLRMDRDNVRRKGKMEEILEEFSRGDAQILVGTQMISKGHNFPGVTLVAVVDGDLGLNLPDYRATERVYQMLVQVSGRAGRGDVPGKVLIQTRNPAHYCWQYIQKGDYESFYAAELERRKRFVYPPFCRLGLIRCTFPWDWSENDKVLKNFSRLADKLARKYGLKLLGPAPAPLYKLNGRERHQCLIKSDEWPVIRSFFYELQQGMCKFNKCRITMDLDPLNML